MRKKPANKYDREIGPDAHIDVYDVLVAFKVTCPATAHAIKKLLAAGQRGSKTLTQDLQEAGASIERAIDLIPPPEQPEGHQTRGEKLTKPTQDPKYGINGNGELCNIATSKPIPKDEPIFILRAQDLSAVRTLEFYLSGYSHTVHADAVANRIRHFKFFREGYAEKMKHSDTVYPFPEIK